MIIISLYIVYHIIQIEIMEEISIKAKEDFLNVVAYKGGTLISEYVNNTYKIEVRKMYENMDNDT